MKKNLSSSWRLWYHLNPLNPKLEWLASSFSLLYHPWILHESHENIGDDYRLFKQLFIVKQILLVSLFENVWRTVWRICILILGCKGLTNRFHVASLCICSAIDHKWYQNAVRTKKKDMKSSRVCLWLSNQIWISSVIYCCTDNWQHGIYLVYIARKQNAVCSDSIYASVPQYIISKDQSNSAHN